VTADPTSLACIRRWTSRFKVVARFAGNEVVARLATLWPIDVEKVLSFVDLTGG